MKVNVGLAEASVHLSQRDRRNPFTCRSVYIGRMAYVHTRCIHGECISGLHEALRVILAPAVTRRIFHASHFLVTDTRLSGQAGRQAATCKRSSLVVLFMAQYAHAAHAVAFNGTCQIGTIYGLSRYFWPRGGGEPGKIRRRDTSLARTRKKLSGR